MTIRTGALLGAAALALSLSGCGQKSDPFAGATPDVAGLTLEVQGGAAEGLPAAALATGTMTSAAEASLIASPPTDGDDLAVIRGELHGINGELRRVIGKVEEAAAGGGVPAVGDRMIYGPADRCVVPDAAGTGCTAWANFVLGVKREREHVFTWLLEARPQGSTDQAAFKPVAAGWLARGRHLHRGVGRLALNLRNLKTVQPAYLGDGFLLAGFANGDQAKALRFLALEFTPDASVKAPLTAAFVGWKNAAGIRRVRVASPQEVLAPASGPDNGKELLLARAAWLPGVAGRTFTIVTNWERAVDPSATPVVLDGIPTGDVPGATWNANYYFGRACYTPATTGAPLTLRFKEWFLCNRSPVPESPAACVLRQGGAGTVVAGSGAWSDAGNCLLQVDQPELADPGGDADHPEDDGDEPGMTGSGMQSPPTVPTGPNDVAAPPATGMGGMTPMM